VLSYFYFTLDFRIKILHFVIKDSIFSILWALFHHYLLLIAAYISCEVISNLLLQLNFLDNNKIMIIIFLLLNVIAVLVFFSNVIFFLFRLRKLDENTLKNQIKKELQMKGLRRKRTFSTTEIPTSSKIPKPFRRKPSPLKISTKFTKPITDNPTTQLLEIDTLKTLKELPSPTHLLRHISHTAGNDNSPFSPDDPRITSRSDEMKITLESPQEKMSKKIFPISQFSRSKMSLMNASTREILTKNDISDTSRALFSNSPTLERFSRHLPFRTTIEDVKMERSEEKIENITGNDVSETSRAFLSMYSPTTERIPLFSINSPTIERISGQLTYSPSHEKVIERSEAERNEIATRNDMSDTSRALFSIYSPTTERIQRYLTFRTTIEEVKKELDETEKYESCEVSLQLEDVFANIPKETMIDIAYPTMKDKSVSNHSQKNESEMDSDIDELN